MSAYLGIFPQELACGPFWPQIEALLSQAMPFGRGEYTLDDIRLAIIAGHTFAIGAAERGVVEFVAVCSIAQFPRKRVLYVQYGAGAGGARLKDALIEAARILECDWIETRCREAVARLYRRTGFDTAYQVAILEIPQ